MDESDSTVEMNAVDTGRPSRIQRVKMFVNECVRVIRVTRKPDAQEYKTTLKVTALGFAAIGILGFLIQIVVQLIQSSMR